ncbi:MAG: efflux RND transporter permease subunit, partial [Coleofasciculaceae cyanobacterium]
SSIFPLTIATGAGAGSRQSLGTAVFGGMFVATFLSLFLVPIIYIVIKSLSERLFGLPNQKQEQKLVEAERREEQPKEKTFSGKP